MIILGIETSCDETAASLLEVKNGKFKLLSNIVASQIDIHKKYGGVVPEVAARKHVESIIPIIKEAFALSLDKIDYIAVTNGPGLNTSLLVGTETAKVLSYLLKKPLIGVNHIEAHLYSSLLSGEKLILPALALIVSGGHTQLILIKGYGNYKIIGQTNDDAAGEAFDKVAKILGLSYPGGPIISKRAQKGNAQKFNFPRPMASSKNHDFSFSGLKTAVLYTIKDPVSKKYKIKLNNKNINDVCASFQQAVVDVLVLKTIKAAKKYKVKSVMLGGGVSANKELREQLEKNVKENLPKVKCQLSEIKYSTDNAAMIAIAGYFHCLNKKFTKWNKIKVDPNLSI